MPELPDVEVARSHLAHSALHQRIRDVDVRTAKVLRGVTRPRFASALRGRSLEDTRRHGKYLLARLDDGSWLVLHFGMTGSLAYVRSGEDEPEHARIVLDLAGGHRLAYVSIRLLGAAELAADADAFVRDRGLGPDALSDELDLATLRELAHRSRARVKSLLMDQSTIAGIGNVYSDEILLHAGIHPAAGAADLTDRDVARLRRAMRRVLRTAIRHRADPDAMPATWLLPVRESGAPCPRCSGRVRRITFSGRSAYVCPSCQPAPG